MSDGDFSPCVSCGVPQPAAFCAACGEKRLSHHDFSIRHFFQDAFEHITHLDFNSWRALTALVIHPGALTRDYLEGRRKGRIGPVKLFVILNVAFALLIGFTGWRPLNTPLRAQLEATGFSKFKRPFAERAMQRKGLSAEEFTREFDAEANVASKEWVFVMIPMFALLLAALYGFRRYYYEHLVFATYFYCFVLLAFLAFSFTFDYLVAPVARAARLRLNGEDMSVLLILAALSVHLFFALRRAYGDGVTASVLRTAVLTLTFFPILQAYRFLLFFETLWAMR